MILLAVAAGYLIGSLPTAIWLGRLRGVDLRSGGTGNPGANNARRLGGNWLAAAILLVEVAKGLTAVVVGDAIANDAGAVAAGLAAITGNVYNVWLGWKGGKGLSISGGVLLGIWPAAFPVAVATLLVASAMTHSSGRGSLLTLGALVLGAAWWWWADRTATSGVGDSGLVLVAVVGMSLILSRKHWFDARNPIRPPGRP